MSRPFGFLFALAALGSALLKLRCVHAQGGAIPGSNSTRALNNNDQYGLYSDLEPAMAIVVVVTVCFFISGFCFISFYAIYICHCSEESAAGSHYPARATTALLAGAAGNSRYLRRGLDPSVVDSFPVLAYVVVKDYKLGKGALECAVCLTEFDDFDSLKILPNCEHPFHPDCIDAWLTSHVTCPVCRADQTPDPCIRCAAPDELAIEPTRISLQHVEEEEEEQQPPCDEIPNEVRINIVGGGGGDEESGEAAAAGERSTAAVGRLPKSHSTGHLLAPARPGSYPDHHAIGLPEEVRKQIRLVASASAKNGIKRSTSYEVLLAIEGCSPKADKICCKEDRTEGGDREFEVGERSVSRLPV